MARVFLILVGIMAILPIAAIFVPTSLEERVRTCLQEQHEAGLRFADHTFLTGATSQEIYTTYPDGTAMRRVEFTINGRPDTTICRW